MQAWTRLVLYSFLFDCCRRQEDKPTAFVLIEIDRLLIFFFFTFLNLTTAATVSLMPTLINWLIGNQLIKRERV